VAELVRLAVDEDGYGVALELLRVPRRRQLLALVRRQRRRQQDLLVDGGQDVGQLARRGRLEGDVPCEPPSVSIAAFRCLAPAPRAARAGLPGLDADREKHLVWTAAAARETPSQTATAPLAVPPISFIDISGAGLAAPGSFRRGASPWAVLIAVCLNTNRELDL